MLDALRARVGADWRGADQYTLEYLGAHAAQVGPDTLRELFEDVGFLLRTNPDVMLPLAAGLARDCDGAALYGRVAGSFARASGEPPPPVLLERKALLSATAFVSHRDATYRTLQRADGFLPWQEYWTDAPPDPLEWRRAGPLGGAQALSWRAGAGVAGLARTDSLTAGGLGEIQTLSPESGARLLTRRLPRTGGERGRALSEVREVGAGTGWVTVARDDHAVYFWRAGARMPDQEYRWGGTLRALAVANVEARVWPWRPTGTGSRFGPGGSAGTSTHSCGRSSPPTFDNSRRSPWVRGCSSSRRAPSRSNCSRCAAPATGWSVCTPARRTQGCPRRHRRWPPRLFRFPPRGVFSP